MAAIGAFIAADPEVVMFLKYNMRSQTYAKALPMPFVVIGKALPMPFVVGGMKRLELMKNHPEFRDNLWTIVRALQEGFRKRGFDIGDTTSPVTP
eukprot:gene47382-63509_t